MGAVAAILQAFLVIAGPLAFAAWFRRGARLPWGLYGAGALAFVASQVVHLPLPLPLMQASDY